MKLEYNKYFLTEKITYYNTYIIKYINYCILFISLIIYFKYIIVNPYKPMGINP